jgi:CRISPR-associated protein Csx14
MAKASIPVDLFNPGQVFACMGFLEAADVLLGNAAGGFTWGDGEDSFRIAADGEVNPVVAVLSFVKQADVRWLSPRDDLRERDGGETEIRAGIADSKDPQGADLPGVLRGCYDGLEREISFGYWADGSSRFSTTFKKSTYGASSHIRFHNALSSIRTLDEQQVVRDPLNQGARTESLFRLDPRGSADPVHAGFSPDRLRKGEKGGLDVRVLAYPVCELFAVLGLQHTRPERVSPRCFAYFVWRHSALLPLPLARAAVGGGLALGEIRRFVVQHDEVKKGGDRQMSSVTEELNP